jgi:anion-transporting  ArsA/GET3 family ATPase
MASLLERKLVVVTGKGGTGKTTVSCALGLIAARRGLRTIVVELGDQHRLPTLFGAASGEERKLEESLWSTSIDPDRAMIEWLGALTGRISARMLSASTTFQYFAAAAPGVKELVTMRKVLELCEGSTQRANASGGVPRHYDLVVLDAPATGHALAMLRSPRTFSAIARVGPVADQTRKVQQLLEDRSRCAYVAVAHPSEMAVTETLELEEQLRRLLDRDLDAVFVNGMLPQRFTREELLQLEQLEREQSGDHTSSGEQTATRGSKRPPGQRTETGSVVHAALSSARMVHRRARFQQSQVARLRRQRFANGAPPGVLTIPFQFVPEIDLTGIETIADRVQRNL